MDSDQALSGVPGTRLSPAPLVRELRLAAKSLKGITSAVSSRRRFRGGGRSCLRSVFKEPDAVQRQDRGYWQLHRPKSTKMKLRALSHPHLRIPTQGGSGDRKERPERSRSRDDEDSPAVMPCQGKMLSQVSKSLKRKELLATEPAPHFHQEARRRNQDTQRTGSRYRN